MNGIIDDREREKNLNAVGWGLFFVWAGIATLAGAGWGAGLFVTGLIVLGLQAARRYLALEVEGFWVGVGILFVLGGVWHWFNVRVAFVPVILLLAGFALLASTLSRRHAH